MTAMTHFSLLLFFLFLSGFPLRLVAAEDPQPGLLDGRVIHQWAHEVSDLEADSKVTWGVLENGVRYAILPNPEPPGRVSLRLYVDVGSVMEDDDQQGMAHFLEHMAFNGTRSFPAGEMVEYFQRLGMAFGADTNAHTSFKETVYKLELPKVDSELLDTSFSLLSEYADGMLLEESEINKERGIILSEKLSRDSVSYRTMVEGFKFSLPDSKISSRLPIGTEQAIRQMSRPRFLDFYETYYTPSRLVVVAVGDCEAAAIQTLIATHFGRLEARSGSPDPALGRVTTGRGVVARVHHEEEMPYTRITFEVTRPYVFRRDDAQARFRDLQLGLADRMLSRRFQILAKKEGSPVLQVRVSRGDFLDFVEGPEMQITCKAERWEEALALGEQELRRALDFGFTQAELEEAKAKVLNAYEQSAKAAATRKSKNLSSALVRAIAGKKVFTHPATDLPRVAAALEKIDKDACLSLFRQGWDSRDLNIFLGGNAEIAGGEEQVLAVHAESRTVAVTAPEEEKREEFAYTEFGEPGTIASRDVEKDLGITQVVLSNGVRVNLKPTGFEENTIHVTARFGAGQLVEPEAKPGLATFASATFTEGGLGRHSADELVRILAAHSVGRSFSVEEDAFVLSGSTTPEDLQLQLQLLAASLVDPGYRDEGARQFQKSIGPMYKQLAHTMEGVMQNQVARFIHGGDFRFGFPEQPVLESRTVEEVRDWMADPLATRYLELSLVGDLELEGTLELVAATFGALPQRAAKKEVRPDARKLTFPEAGAREFTFRSEIPKAAVFAYWPTADIWDIGRSRRLGLLGDVFADRLRKKVREELGESYSPGAYHMPSDVWEGYGYLVAMVTLKPEQAERVGEILIAIGDELAHGEIGEDEFQRAKAPRIARLDQLRRENSYWMDSVLQTSQEHPQRIDWARTILPDYAAITCEEVAEQAQEYLSRERVVVVQLIPESVVTADPPSLEEGAKATEAGKPAPVEKVTDGE